MVRPMFRLSLLFATVVSVATFGRAEVRFSGYLTTRDAVWLVVSEAGGGSHSVESGSNTSRQPSGPALTVSDTIAGDLIQAFDPATETLVLKSATGGGIRKVALSADAKRVRLTGRIEVGGKTHEIVRSAIALGENSRFRLSPEIVFSLRPTLVEDGTLKYAVMVEKSTKEGRQVLSGPLVRAQPGMPAVGKVGDVQYQLMPALR